MGIDSPPTKQIQWSMPGIRKGPSGFFPGVNPLSMPMGAGPYDTPIGFDELGNPIYRMMSGGTYSAGRQPVAQTAPNEPLTTTLDAQGRATHSRQPEVNPYDKVGDFFSGMVQPLTMPGRALRGEPVTLGNVFETGLEAGILGAPVAAPRGALRSGVMRDTSYRMDHTAPVRSPDNAPGHALGELFGDDIYGPNGAAWYGHGGDAVGMDRDTMQILNDLRGNPSAGVDIYRAVPDGVTEINPGDWVSVNKEYALQHGRSWVDGEPNIISQRVSADDIFTDANSIHEFGYSPTPSLSPGQTQAQEVLDLLKDGRGADVTDAMLAAADDQYLFNNYDLPMDEASRVARAREMGFDTKAYHGTPSVFSEFDPTNIRSQFARFDPRLKHLSNLSAGIAGAGMMRSVLSLEEEEQLKAYLGGT